MHILCGQCGRTMDVEDARGGSTVPCVHCGRDIHVPSFDGDAMPHRAAEAPPEEDFATHARQAIQEKIRITCQSCRRKLSIGRRLAGQKGKCPKCGEEILVPSLDDDEEVERILHRTAPVDHEWDFADVEVIESQENVEFAPGPSEYATPEQNPPEPLPEHPDYPPDWQGAPVAEAMVPAPPPAVGTQGEVITLKPTPELENLSAAVRTDALAAKPPKKRSPSLVGVVLIVLLALGGWYGWKYLKQEGTLQGLAPVTQPGANQPGKDKAAQGSVGGAQTPQESNPLIPPANRNSAKCLIRETKFSMFAAGNYLPARPGFVYSRLTVEITATDKPLTFNANGEDVGLVDGQQRYPCLGVPPEKSLIPRVGMPKQISIPAGGKRIAILVFRVPVGASSATLVIRDVTPVSTSIANAIPRIALQNAVGTFDESPPRSLRPLPQNSLVAALQDTGRQRLVIRRDGNGDRFDLRFPVAGVTGKAKFTGEDLFEVELHYGGGVLPCKLRLADPNRMVLYLRDLPFNQMVFARTDDLQRPIE